MTRSTWKGKFIYKFLLNEKFLKRKKKNIWTRNSTIPASLIGKAVFIHNGLRFYKCHITREKVGFKFGQFAYTRALAPKGDAWKAKKDKKAGKNVKKTPAKKGK